MHVGSAPASSLVLVGTAALLGMGLGTGSPRLEPLVVARENNSSFFSTRSQVKAMPRGRLGRARPRARTVPRRILRARPRA